MLDKEQKQSFYKQVHSLAAHTCLQELFAVFANMLNSIMLSFVGQTYLSATTLAGQFISIYTFTSLGLTIAILILASQYYGKKDYESIDKIFHLSLLFSSIMSLIFFIISFFAPHIVMKILTNDTELASIGSEYLKYFSFLFLFHIFSTVYTVIMKSIGKARISTIASIVSTIVNALLSLILIFGYISGKPYYAIGAGIASSISAFVEMLLMLLHSIIFGKVKFSLIKFFQIDPYFIKEIFKYTLPSIFTKFAWSTADTILVSIIGHMSRDMIDAFSLVKLMANIPNAYIVGYSLAFGIVIGHELGRGNTKLAKAYGDDGLKYTLKIAVISCFMLIVLSTIAFIFTGVETTKLFTYICVTAIFVYNNIGRAYNSYINNAAFNIGGEVEFLALIDTVNMWIIMVPISLLLFYVFKVPEIVVCFYIFSNEYTKIVSVYTHYKKYIWVRDLTKNEWFLPIEGSFIDKYKRNFKLKINISLTEFFTKRFENTTDFIFSISKENFSKTLDDLQNYLQSINLDKETAYKTVLAIEEIYTSRDGDYNCDVGVKLKDNKIRFIYYDNGSSLKKILNDKSKTNIQILTSIADKLEFNRMLNLNKILIRINRK